MKSARRGKRRKNPSRTRSRTSKRAVQALAAGAMIAAGTQAYADPIRFDNPAGPGHFQWANPLDTWLDVKLPADSQHPQTGGPGTFGQTISATSGFVGNGNPGDGELQVGGPYDAFLIGVQGGEIIPTGDPWYCQGFSYYSGFGGELPEAVETYLGVRFDAGSGWQYGWIGVVRTGLELDAFAWGYETEAGVPIPAGIPEPGTLALLAFGATALLRRRRCRSQID